MSFLIPIAASILGGVIANNSAKAQQASAQQGASDLSTQTFNQQTAYIKAQEDAQRAAIAQLATQGNPYMQAQGFLRPPNPNQYALPPASGQVYRGGSGTPAAQAPQLAPLPTPQGQGAGSSPAGWQGLNQGVKALVGGSTGTGPGQQDQSGGAQPGWTWDPKQRLYAPGGAKDAVGPNPSYQYSLQGGQPDYTYNGDSGLPESVNASSLPGAEALWASQYGGPPSPLAPQPGALRPPPRFNPLAQRGFTQQRMVQ